MFKNQSSIGWIKSLMELLSHEWADKNTYTFNQSEPRSPAKDGYPNSPKSYGTQHRTFGTTVNTPYMQTTSPSKQKLYPTSKWDSPTNSIEEWQESPSDATFYWKLTSTIFSLIQFNNAFHVWRPPPALGNAFNTGHTVNHIYSTLTRSFSFTSSQVTSYWIWENLRN